MSLSIRLRNNENDFFINGNYAGMCVSIFCFPRFYFLKKTIYPRCFNYIINYVNPIHILSFDFIIRIINKIRNDYFRVVVR